MCSPIPNKEQQNLYQTQLFEQLCFNNLYHLEGMIVILPFLSIVLKLCGRSFIANLPL